MNSNRPETPNHALQRTAPRVTLAAPAASLRSPPAAFPQPARRAPQSLSLGSFGEYPRVMSRLALIVTIFSAVSLLRARAAETYALADSKTIREAIVASKQPVQRVEELPYYVILALARLSGDTEFKIANPKEDYNATDATLDERLPRRQLAFGGISEGCAFVCYNRGGMVAPFCIVVFRLERRFHLAEPLMIAHFFFHPTNPARPPKDAQDLIKAFDGDGLMQYQPTFNGF